VHPRYHNATRVSDADRERAVDALKAAYVYGLVTKDEFDERISQAFTSRTSAVLAVLAFVAAFFAGNPAAGMLALVAAGSGVAGLFLAAALVLGARRGERSGGQLPPQGAIGTQRGIGQRPYSGQPRRQSSADAARSHSPRLRLST
jgi:Domain of unknown function (DUF1707)